MEYYGNETDGMSLEDMINCDIKSEFGEANSEIVRILNGPLTPINTGASSMEGAAGQVSHPMSVSQAQAVMLNSADPKLGADNWMQSINVSSLQQLLQHQQQAQQQRQHAEATQSQHVQEQAAHILMVNPQTGLPVNHQPVAVAAQGGAASTTVARSHSAIQAALLKASPNIQYITINNIASIPNNNSGVQNFGTQASINVNAAISPNPMQVNFGQSNGNVMNSMTHQLLNSQVPNTEEQEKVFPKPVYSYSCLIALALKNSENGCLPVSEIYNFMTENFPYFKTAPDGWKNSVRHNLSLNKCFEKIENPKANGSTKKGCLWGLNPAKMEKMEEELAKWRKKDPVSIQKAMAKPEVLDKLEKGIFNPKLRLKPGYEAVPSIELQPVHTEPINIEPMKEELQVKTERIAVNENGNLHLLSTVNTEGLDLLDNSLGLDPSIGELALQNELLDDLTNEVLKMESEMPISTGPVVQGITSPLTIVSSAASEDHTTDPGAANGSATYQGIYTYANYQSTTQSGTNSIAVTRTLEALT